MSDAFQDSILKSIDNEAKLLDYLSDYRLSKYLNDLDQARILNLAIHGGHLNIVKILLDHGFDINKLDGFSRSPLVYSMVLNHIEIMDYLIDQGAKTNITPILWHRSLLDYTYYNNHTYRYNNSLKNLFARFFSVNIKFWRPGDFRIKGPRRIMKFNDQMFMEVCKFSLACKAKIINKFDVFEFD